MLSDGSYDWSLVEDEQGHGTAVTGVIAASMDGNGVVGIAPQVNIIVIKAECDEHGNFERTSDLVFGLYYAIERDVAVVNMSFGTTDASNPFAEPAQLAFDSDVICVAAAGNETTANLTYPAADENVFGVGALEEDSWELAAYSNYGENVDFVAPGTVYTTKMGGGYGGMNGTSFASPITAGVLALYMSQNKYAEFNTVEELIYASCYDLGDLGPDWYYGYGALDVSALMLEERGTVTFNMMTDELDNTEQVFIREHTLQDMPEPERLYAIFDGWYYDPQCTEEYVWYEDEFHSDLTLYANWVNEEDGVPYTYVELDDGTIEIRSYTGHRRYITIPEYIDGKVVSSIGEFAFKGETRLREVKLPKYLKRIRTSAFEGCSNLVSMEIPDTVTEISNKAFLDNVRLSALTFGENSQLISIGDYAFSGCAKMRTFTVPSKVTELNSTAFYRNTSMIAYDVQAGNTAFTAKGGVLFNYTGSTLVCYPAGLGGTYTVPENVQTIGDLAFAFTRLSGVELSKVQSLGGSAFIYGSLESIIIPDSVTSMGGSVFASNAYLRSAKLGFGLTCVSDNAFASTALTSIEIPATIRSIESGAFAGIGTLADVAFAPDSTLTYIGISAFGGSGVVSVEIPASVVTIDAFAFSSNSLCSITFAENSALHTIGEYAFALQYQLTAVTLPNRLAHLGDFAFKETGIQTVDIPASVTYLGAGVFASCHSLTDIFVDDANSHYADVNGVVYNTEKTVLVEYPAGNIRTKYNVLNGITDIDSAAFYGSWNLQYVYFQEGLKHIHPYAFFDTINIERIDLPNSVEILDEYSFFGCGAKQYGLSQNLREIKMYAISKNTRLTRIAIPDSVIQISNFAFAENWSLSSVTFTENAKLPRISYGAFAYCGLTSFRVPANVSTMAQGAFMGCSKLQSFTFAKNSRLESISAYMFDGCSNLRTITFEKGSALTSIQAHGLEGMRKLTKIDFGDAKLTNIDNFAFRFCESLTRFDIPEGVTFLGRYAFYYCTKLAEVTVPSTMDFIGRFAFLGTNKLNVYFTSETLPANLAEDWDHGTQGYYLGVTDVVTDGDWTYAKLTSGNISIIKYSGTATDIDLNALNLGGDIVNIGGGAFMDSSVERILLPETLQIIQTEAFDHSELKSVSVPASVTFIGRSAFAYTPIETLTFAPNAQVKTIEQSAFEKTEKLGSVVIPSSVTTLGRAVFKNSGITSLTFADGFSMTEISEEAFAYTRISSVTIPDSVTLINHNAFREIKELKSVTFGSGENLMIMSNVFYQSGLETVYIPENVDYVGEYAFVGLSKLTEFTVSENNPYYKAVDGLLVSKNGRKLVAVPAGREGSLTVPEGIEVIGFGAFEDSKLSEIKFLDNANILSFGYRAFYNADGITDMHIPASVVAIDYYAFAMCDNLQTVTFAEDNNLKGVYEGAFYGCKNLSDITLPDSIVEISDFAFYGCRSLTDVPVSETSKLKGIYDYAFAYAGFSGDYSTPETLIDIGPYAFMGNRFTSITVPDTNCWDLIIGIGAFEDCQELTEITVPFIGASFEDDKITWFGYIFGAGAYKANNTYVPESLKKVNISEGITFVGEGAFSGLTGLEEMSIPHSVQMVYEYAFSGTTVRYELTNEITFLVKDKILINQGNLGKGIAGHLMLSDEITTLDYAPFKGCENLVSITIPDSVVSFRYSTFAGCKSLTNIVFGDNCQLTSINEYMFQDCINLKSITIPDSIISIEKYAFWNCSNLSSVVFGDNCHLTSIGDNAFYKCGNLVNITIPDSVTSIGYRAFSDCNNLTSITIPDSVTSIGSYAFRDCAALTSITIPGNIANIENGMFHSCSNLTSITIPESVTSIGDYVFVECSSLVNIEIPESVTNIGTSTFRYCSSLKNISLPNGITNIPDFAFGDCENLESISIPDSVINIGSHAFVTCSNLTAVSFSQNSQLQYIGNNAFAQCSCLKKFTIPSTLTSIGNGAFYSITAVYNYSDLTFEFGSYENGGIAANARVIIDKNGNKTYRNEESTMEYIATPDGFLFTEENGVYKLIHYFGTQDTIVLPLNIKGNPYVIDCLHGARNVIIPEGITRIGDKAFYYCKELKSITIPNSVTSIGRDAFRYCGGLTAVIFGDESQLTDIGEWAFSDCSSLTDIAIPNSVKNIAIGAFLGCRGLTSIEIPDSVTSIGDSAFYKCSSLTSITIPDGVTSIGNSTFSSCSSLTSITIPDGITSIGSSAFSDCTNLISITIPDSVTNIGSSAFSNCTALQLTVEENNLNFTEIEGVIYDKEITKLIYLPDSITELCLPKTVTTFSLKGNTNVRKITFEAHSAITEINSEAFSGCSNLTNIAIPDGVTSIGAYAFLDCSSLTSIEIPDSVASIGYSAFSGCGSLTSIDLGDNSQLTSINSYMFLECSSLMSVTIPDSVTSIGWDAFSGCSSLTSISISDNVAWIGRGAFQDCSSLESISIPQGITDIEESTFSGCRSLTDIIIPNNVTSIGYSAFSGCRGLTSITIPDSVTSIGNNAFGNCSSIKKVYITDITSWLQIDFKFDNNPLYHGAELFIDNKPITKLIIPDGITSIDDWALAGCSKLTSIIIPDSVTSIGHSAFSWCSSLTSIDIPDSVTSIGDGAFSDCSSLTSIEIPDGVTSIGSSAFNKCSNLTSIEIPDSVTNIGDYAFFNCYNLMDITIPDGVISIDYCAFYGCSSLRLVENHSNLPLLIGSTDYGWLAYYAKCVIDKNGNRTYPNENYIETADGFLFANKEGIYQLIAYLGIENEVTLPKNINGAYYQIFEMQGVKNVIIPDGVTNISDHAFRNCGSLVSITIPDSVTGIGACAFEGCISLTSIIIPDSVTEIGAYAFKGCGSLTSITIPNSMNSIGDAAFHGCSALTSVIFLNCATSIGTATFSDCGSLTNISIPDSVTSIGDGAFNGCISLTSINIPNSVTSIGSSAFSGCSGLTSINIPDSVTSIGSSAFFRCTSLTNIAISDSVTIIGDNAFYDTAYYNDPRNSHNGTLYIGKHLIRVSDDIRYPEFRKDTVSIARGAFVQCYLLKKAIVMGYCEGILSRVSNLETLFIVDMPTRYIYQYFGSYPSDIPLTLKSIVLGKDVQMRANAFYGITGITIYVEANEKDVRWDENFPGWNNGNKVVYGDDWIAADFYDQNGNLMSSEIFLTHQVIRQPYLELTEGLEKSQVLVGWDIDGDGKPDTIPATSTENIVARPIIEARASEYTVSFFDADGVTLISKVILPYGAVIVPPAIEDKMGYTTSGWIGFTEGMTVSGNHAFVLDRTHNGDGHDYNAPVWVAPTCTEKGYNKHICLICGEWYVTDEVEAVGHNYISSETATTCTENGEIKYTCTACDHVYTEVIPAHGHDYVGNVTKSATCTKHGEILYVCAYCGDLVNEQTPMTAHNYQKKTAPKWWLQILIERILNVFFGYEGDNIFYYECVDCKHIQTAQESSAGSSGTAGIMSSGCVHHLSDWTEYILPTCEGDGVEARICLVCEKVVEIRRGLSSTGHEYVEHIITPPTCAKNGYTTHICSDCGCSYTDEFTPKVPHEYQVYVFPPSCSQKGYTLHSCIGCMDTYTDSITEKIPHKYVASVTDPTCYRKGYTTYTCSVCNDSYIDNEVAAHGHIAGAEADCQNDQTCTACGKVLAKKLGHDYEAVVTSPTCIEKGYTTFTCSRCRDSYIDNKTIARGHKPGEWIVDAEPAPGVEGNKHTECTVCGETLETAVIEALPAETEPETETGLETEVPTESDSKQEDPKGSNGCFGVVSADVFCLIILMSVTSLIFVKRREENC